MQKKSSKELLTDYIGKSEHQLQKTGASLSLNNQKTGIVLNTRNVFDTKGAGNDFVNKIRNRQNMLIGLYNDIFIKIESVKATRDLKKRITLELKIFKRGNQISEIAFSPILFLVTEGISKEDILEKILDAININIKNPFIIGENIIDNTKEEIDKNI